ncbi:MAG: tellurite resistance TerB C-terminal domain-containing protein [Nostocaceae cyanobacterium]|nr:tellurite resistance TerB C-terminal domain-containing protein [Nostocaceae cyanobacterium]
MTLKANYSDNFTRLKTSNMQSAMVSNRFILGIVALGVSFGLSLVLTWEFITALITGFITIFFTYAALYIDKRQRNYEMMMRRDFLYRRIQELEELKLRVVAELNQLESYLSASHKEANKIQNQILEYRHQRDSLNRELSNFIIQKKQVESQISYLQTEVDNLEATKKELNNTCGAINAEQRRLELNFNLSKAEITQLHNQIGEIQQEKENLESELTLLERLKPQLESKLHSLRGEIEKREIQHQQHNEVLESKSIETERLESRLTLLQKQIVEQRTELNNLQEQVLLLQTERDQLQNQVWELLPQVDSYSHENLPEEIHEGDGEMFPFADLIESLEFPDLEGKETENLTEEWQHFLKQIPEYELQVLKVLLEEENPHPAIKQIAESSISMPQLLIDSINELAKNTIGELIINTNSELPEIYPEYMDEVRQVIAIYDDLIAKQASSN